MFFYVFIDYNYKILMKYNIKFMNFNKFYENMQEISLKIGF